MTLCVFCLAPDHLIQHCPSAKALAVLQAHGVIDPMAEEPDMAIVDRLHRLRAYVRGLLTDMRRAGLEPSPETVALTPPLDHFE